MEKLEVVGIQNVDFTNQENGQRICGVKLHCYGEPDYPENFSKGSCQTFSIWFGSDDPLLNTITSFKFGDEIEVSRNRRGRIISAKIVK